jgi:hypothetical protein
VWAVNAPGIRILIFPITLISFDAVERYLLQIQAVCLMKPPSRASGIS